MKGATKVEEKGADGKKEEVGGGKRKREWNTDKGIGEAKELNEDVRDDVEKKKVGIKKAMKKILKKAPKKRLKRDGLVSALAIMLGQRAPDNLGDLVDKKAENSTMFRIKKGRVSLASTE